MAPDNCDEMEIVTNIFFLIMTYIQCYSQLTTGQKLTSIDLKLWAQNIETYARVNHSL